MRKRQDNALSKLNRAMNSIKVKLRDTISDRYPDAELELSLELKLVPSDDAESIEIEMRPSLLSSVAGVESDIQFFEAISRGIHTVRTTYKGKLPSGHGLAFAVQALGNSPPLENLSFKESEKVAQYLSDLAEKATTELLSRVAAKR
jgi:hypothetical protein